MSSDYVSNTEVEDFLFKTRRINLVGEIDDYLASNIIGQLQYFSQKRNPVYLYISTMGGCWCAGHSIIDQINLSPFKVCTIVRGQALSMGALIAAYGTRGYRYITPSSSILLHPMVFGTEGTDSVSKYKSCSDFWYKDYEYKIKKLAKRMEISTKKALELIEKNCWLNSKDAIKYGLIDRIWTHNDEMGISCEE